MKPATITDVSKKSGISIATVSKYLNGGNVRPITASKIQEAIEALNYRANQSARSLRTSKSMIIGILVDNIKNNFYNDIISQVSDLFQALNFSCIICETHENKTLFKNRLDFLASRGIDGLVVLSSNIPFNILAPFNKTFNNIVVVDSLSNKININSDFVITDNLAASYQATEQFIIKGHKDIAIITGSDEYFSAKERLTGYKRVLSDYGLAINNDFILQDTYDAEGGYRSFKKIINLIRMGNKPTAVLITSYFMTVGSIIAINEENIHIPDDISVICFDNYDINKIFYTKLCCMIQPSDEISQAIVNRMLDRISGNNSEKYITRLPAILSQGNSGKKIRLISNVIEVKRVKCNPMTLYIAPFYNDSYYIW